MHDRGQGVERRQHLPAILEALFGLLGERPRHDALEVRHESFNDPRFADLARRHGAAIVVADHDSHPRIDAPTADFTYARLMQTREDEETGYAAADLELLMACPSSAGMSDEIIHFVLATGLTRVGPGGGDASESIEVLPVPLSQVDAWLAARLAKGTPMDPKIYAALYWLQQSGHHELR